MRDAKTSDPVTVVTVCTGNICRSPSAELLLRSLSARADIRFDSAGTHALVGKDMPAPASRLLAAALEQEMTPHSAKQLDMQKIKEASLILGMAGEHKKFVCTAFPPAISRTFTILEFNALLNVYPLQRLMAELPEDASTGDRLIMANRLLRRARGGLPSGALNSFDVIDPYGRDDDVYEASFEQMLPACQNVAKFFRNL